MMIRPRLVWNVTRLQTTASTSDDARRAAEQGAAEGAVVWALSQSAGRGRQGRQWHSPVGNLYCSAILRPIQAQSEYVFYSFVAALAIADAIASFIPETDIKLKWPNDVLANEKKISGILLEAGDGYLIVGMGVNVLHTPENPLYPVTSLAAETPNPPTVESVLNKVLNALATWRERFDQDGFAPVRAAWLARARKGEMRVRQAEGDIHGLFTDLDEQGRLHLLLSDGSIRSFNTGDVFF